MSGFRPPGLWLTNHLANPVVRRLLHGRLGRRMGAHVGLIRYRGRRSGRTYELPVQYVRENGRVWIRPGMPQHKTWWRNLRGGAEVDVTMAGRSFHGWAVALDARDDPEGTAAGVAAYQAGRARSHQARLVRRGGNTELAIGTPRHRSETVVVRVDLAPEMGHVTRT